MLKMLFIREIQIKTIMRYHLTPAECPSSESLQVTNAGECEERESSYTVGGNESWNDHYGKQYGGSLKN